MEKKLNKVFVDSCIFTEIILHQPRCEKTKNLIKQYEKISLFYINPKIISEVCMRIEDEIELNFRNRTFKIKYTEKKEINTMRKDFYIEFEKLLESCRLIIPNENHECFSKIKNGLNNVRFNTKKSDLDKYHLITAISREMNLFITLDGAIIQEKEKIKSISNGRLEIVSV